MNFKYFYGFIVFLVVIHNHAQAKDEKIADVMALVTSEASGGLQEKDLNQSALKRLEEAFIEIVKTSMEINLSGQGIDLKKHKIKIVSSSVYVVTDKNKLAVIRLNINNLVRHAMIFGIKGNELYRVTCIRGSNHMIPIFYGVCGKKVNEVFNVNVK